MDKNGNNKTEEISLSDFIAIFKRNVKFITLITGVFIGISLLISLALTITNPVLTRYKATTVIQVVDGAGFTSQKQALIAVMKSDWVVTPALAKFGIFPYEEVRGTINAVESTIPNGIEISVIHGDPELAKSIANEVRTIGLQYANTAMAFSNVTLVESAKLDDSAIIIGQPANYVLNAVMGAVLGMLAGAFLVFMHYFGNHKIRREADINRFTGKNMLVAIPDTRKKSRKFYEVR
ncbi:MAG: hypothetical protein HGA49_08505 [Eubacteriaceae bacterium]|nr:hypothetical protein [Eubacteriaceae bacterium]